MLDAHGALILKPRVPQMFNEASMAILIKVKNVGSCIIATSFVFLNVSYFLKQSIETNL